MSKADNLRVRDLRDTFRLIGECRDLGSHPALWHGHMLEALAARFGAVQASGGEARWNRPSGSMEPLSAYSSSTEQATRNACRAYHRDEILRRDPIFQAIQTLPAWLVTRTRRQLVPDRAWYRSAGCTYRRMGGTDHVLTSVVRVSDDGATNVIALNRAIGERDFSPREQRLVSFLHAELGRLIRGPLVSATEPGFDGLSRRLRETLDSLLEGDSEKQVAARLGLSAATIHQYVTALYRHFGVGSRAQLLVHVLKRMPPKI